MPYSFELVRVEYDFPMLELRSSEIIDDRHLTIIGHSVDYIDLPPIVRSVSSVVFRALIREDMALSRDEDFEEGLKYASTLELLHDGVVAGRIVCAQVACVATPAFKFDRIASNFGEVSKDSSTELLFNWQAGEFQKYRFG